VSQDPQDSERSSTMRGDSSASCSSPSKTPNSSNNSNGFEDYYSAATPGFKNAFNILGEGPASQNYTSPSSSSSKSPKSTIHTSIDNSSPQKQQLTRSPRSPPLFTKSSSASPPNTPPPTETPSPAASAMSQKRTSRASSPLGNNNNNNNHMTTRTTRTRSPSPARVQAKTPTRASSPMRAASPLHSLKNKLTKSKAVSKALEDESTNAAASVSEKSKEGSTHTSGCNSSPTKTSSSHGGSPPRRSKGRLRGRSPSPLHMLKPSGSKDTLENNDSNENTLDVDDERGTTISSTPSFSLGKTSFRSMSPSRLTKTLKSKLVSASPKWERPPQPKLPLHPGGSEDGTSKNSFDDGLDQIELRLGGTTMSFDVDDNKASEGDIEEENADVNVDELDIEENGCVINTTSFNIFERKEFLRAMGCGQVEATSTVVNYIQKGDALCEQGGEQLERAVQIYYAALGAVISRIREWTMERQQEERDSSIASGENDAPPVSLPTLSSLSYDDFVNAANCAEVNVLLIVMSTILLRTGNIHFRLRHFESACRDYSSAQSYQMLRTKAQSNHAIHESLMLEDAKLNGRIKNNMASALSKRQMFEEARVEYTKALQIKQNTLEALHKTTRENGESVKVVDDKHLVSDIASTFHNIGLLRLNCDEPVKAEKAFKQSLSLRVKKFGLDDLRVSSTLNALGGLYYQTKRYDDAFRSYKESLRIWKLNGGKSDLTTAEHYYNIGLVFYAKGPYSKAKVSVAECAKIRRQMCGNVSLPVAESLYLFGKISLSSGHYEEAFDKFQEALAIRQKLLGKDHLLVSNVHLPMGKVYHDMEEFDKAMSSFSIALAIRSDRLGKYNVSVAEVLHAIGSVYITLEEYSKALETLQEALRLQRNFLGPSLEVAETLNKMSLVFFKSGDTERAIELGEESLDILKSVAGFDHLLVAHVLKNVGDYYQYKEAYDDAMEAYSESLRIMALWLGREHILLSKTLSEVGVVRFKTGEYTIAKQSFMEVSLRMYFSTFLSGWYWS
jgi:tetratricopeptide (TPR) repeat protein